MTMLQIIEHWAVVLETQDNELLVLNGPGYPTQQGAFDAERIAVLHRITLWVRLQREAFRY